ncbi:HK97 family phage prohead protease [Mycobacterium sp. PDNC021]|uniref:HK97 family phage prohead protease n=1 Tax=Mycobacterium sp. PDNC021 TaxID=3391399 RepID=UPI003AACDAE4
MARSEAGLTERLSVPGLVEVRADAGARTIGGYAAKFNRMSQNLGGFVERIDPAFFNKSRGDGWPDVIARYNHDDNMVLGTSKARTLRLSVDGTGLMYEADLPPSRTDVYELVQRGDVNQSSFAFYTLEDDWGVTDQGFPLRTLVSGKLVDVAPVNTPAYVDTSVGLRSLAAKFDAPLEEVQKLASRNELRRLIVRTDATPPERRRSARHALAMAAAASTDPGLRSYNARLALTEAMEA